MQRYFAKEKHDDNFILYEKDYHHIKNVMRYIPGDEVEIIYDNVMYHSRITSLEPISFEIIDSFTEEKSLPVNLTVAVSLVNEQKFDLIIQKLTELGVSRIIPVKTERSIVKLDTKKEDKKLVRWSLICKEASEQSKRTDIPVVNQIMTLKELATDKTPLKLICSLNENTKTLDKYLKDNIKDILFVIGPEGGFSKNEEEYLLANGFAPTSLGKRVLRVETAAIYVASIISYVYER